MSTPQCVMDGKPATLHVFVQDGAWQWGISVPRERGCGSQVIAYNERGFASESDADPYCQHGCYRIGTALSQ